MNQLSFLDLLTIASFAISIENLEENMTQSDKQDLQKELSDKTDLLLKEIHQHLEQQDKKIDEILRRIDK